MLRKGPVLLLLPVLLAAGIIFQSCATSAPPPPTPPEAPAPPPPPPLPTTRLEPGRAVTLQTWGEDSLFVFVGQASEVISLRVNSMSPGLDPNVSLVDPEGQVEASDDDSGGHGNSLIKDHALKKTGQYTAIVRSSDRAQGKVEVLLEVRRGS